MSITEISIIICSIAFVALVVFLIKVLVTLNKQLQSTTEISDDLNYKLKSLDSLFRTLSMFGETIEQRAAHSETSHTRSQNRVAMFVEWALLGLDLWNKSKRRDKNG